MCYAKLRVLDIAITVIRCSRPKLDIITISEHDERVSQDDSNSDIVHCSVNIPYILANAAVTLHVCPLIVRWLPHCRASSSAANLCGFLSVDIQTMARSMDNAAGVGDDESGEDEQFFADLLGKQNLREGAKVAHRAAKDRKGKQKEVVGGGSFQSLGALIRLIALRAVTQAETDVI